MYNDIVFRYRCRKVKSNIVGHFNRSSSAQYELDKKQEKGIEDKSKLI